MVLFNNVKFLIFTQLKLLSLFSLIKLKKVKMNNFKIINLPKYNSDKGSLTVLERELNFEIKRIYWIYEADNQKRGGHKHKLTIQGLIAISGEVKIKVIRDKKTSFYMLNNPSECLILEPEDWHEMDFSKNAILLVLASRYYEKEDYIYTP